VKGFRGEGEKHKDNKKMRGGESCKQPGRGGSKGRKQGKSKERSGLVLVKGAKKARGGSERGE